MQSCPKSIDTKLQGTFSYAMLSGASRTHGIRSLPVQCCPKSIKAKLHRIFLCNVIWSLSGNIPWGFELCNVVPRVLRQHCIGCFLIESCLEPLGQHCIGFSAVQCCAKSIKTILHRIFSYALLLGASRI